MPGRGVVGRMLRELGVPRETSSTSRLTAQILVEPALASIQSQEASEEAASVQNVSRLEDISPRLKRKYVAKKRKEGLKNQRDKPAKKSYGKRRHVVSKPNADSEQLFSKALRKKVHFHPFVDVACFSTDSKVDEMVLDKQAYLKVESPKAWDVARAFRRQDDELLSFLEQGETEDDSSSDASQSPQQETQVSMENVLAMQDNGQAESRDSRQDKAHRGAVREAVREEQKTDHNQREQAESDDEEEEHVPVFVAHDDSEEEHNEEEVSNEPPTARSYFGHDFLQALVFNVDQVKQVQSQREMHQEEYLNQVQESKTEQQPTSEREQEPERINVQESKRKRATTTPHMEGHDEILTDCEQETSFGTSAHKKVRTEDPDEIMTDCEQNEPALYSEEDTTDEDSKLNKRTRLSGIVVGFPTDSLLKLKLPQPKRRAGVSPKGFPIKLPGRPLGMSLPRASSVRCSLLNLPTSVC